jgi:PRC-barrel domain
MATEARETAGLIGSDKVEGTYVYDAHGQHIGSIERVMIEKRSGQVAYAVLSFGGFLGIGSDYYPIPWASLSYDTSLGGVPHQHYGAAAQRCAEVHGQSLGLGGSRAWPPGLRLLRRVVARILSARGQGRLPPGRRPCLSSEGVPESWNNFFHHPALSHISPLRCYSGPTFTSAVVRSSQRCGRTH